jgi:hypothetical protein
METLLQGIVVTLFFVGAVWYLYRRIKKVFNPKRPSCGCGCSGCSTEPKPLVKQ